MESKFKDFPTIKCGRYEVTVDVNDVILYNGKCYQIITKGVGRSDEAGRRSPALIAKRTFAQLKKEGLVYTNDMLKDAAKKKYRIDDCEFWIFQINEIHNSPADN